MFRLSLQASISFVEVQNHLFELPSFLEFHQRFIVHLLNIVLYILCLLFTPLFMLSTLIPNIFFLLLLFQAYLLSSVLCFLLHQLLSNLMTLICSHYHSLFLLLHCFGVFSSFALVSPNPLVFFVFYHLLPA